ncbi:MAG: hypothetical protein P9M14_07045, partial [Candidatus Alcyoniella australis]|nr:hypothetical protein [Candidatus Alcyoniella australis]
MNKIYPLRLLPLALLCLYCFSGWRISVDGNVDLFHIFSTFDILMNLAWVCLGIVIFALVFPLSNESKNRGRHWIIIALLVGFSAIVLMRYAPDRTASTVWPASYKTITIWIGINLAG